MEDYTAKLTGEPFLYVETKVIAEYMLQGYTAEELRKKNIEENLIKHKKVGSIERTNAPIFRRLAVLNNDMLNEFVNGDIETSKYILLYAVMKTEKLVKDFIYDVYRDKLNMRLTTIDKYDISTWYEEKKATSNFLQQRSESTSEKLKQVIMKIMQDSGLVKKEKDKFTIIRPLLSEKYIALLNSCGDYDYAKAIGGLI